MFPFVPYPKDKDHFGYFVEQGQKLRMLHLLESGLLESVGSQLQTKDGTILQESSPMNQITFRNIQMGKGRVWINTTECFGDVSEDVWTFWIGAYQPLQNG